MRIYEAIAEHVARLGVRHVFTLMSEETAKLTEEIARRGITVMHTRHEHVAVGMADGYSRASGSVGVAVVGKGPGLTNAVNSLTAAAKGRSRVLVLAGQTAGEAETGTAKGKRVRRNKFVDQPALLSALGVEHVELRSPDSAIGDVDAAFASICRNGGVRVVNMPDELLEAEGATFAPRAADVEAVPPPAEADIAAIADLLETGWAARRPVIVAGRGAVSSGAREALVTLGERIGALLGTSAQAKDLFRGVPFDIGIVGTFSTPTASEFLVESDVVLAFGASLNQYTTYNQSIFGKARIVHIDREAASVSRYQPADLSVAADAKEAAAALVLELERRGHRADGYRTRDVGERLARRSTEADEPVRGAADTIDPRGLWIALDRLIPEDRALVVDGGNFMEWAIAHMSVPGPEAFAWPIDYGAIGCGVGNALGVAAARPDRVTVLAIGDGGLMMALADLDTAVRYRLPVLVIVNNNSALGSELHYLRAHGYAGDSARYVNPSFEDVARGLGLRATTATSIAHLDRLHDWLARPDGPMLLDCRIDPDIASPAKVRLGM